MVRLSPLMRPRSFRPTCHVLWVWTQAGGRCPPLPGHAEGHHALRISCAPPAYLSVRCTPGGLCSCHCLCGFMSPDCRSRSPAVCRHLTPTPFTWAHVCEEPPRQFVTRRLFSLQRWTPPTPGGPQLMCPSPPEGILGVAKPGPSGAGRWELPWQACVGPSFQVLWVRIEDCGVGLCHLL